MTRLFRSIVALTAFLWTVAPGNAHKFQVPVFATAWRAMAATDAHAALALIAQNHPGAALELKDGAFQQHLAIARRHVSERLPLVTDFGGYTALMNGLAADFRDGHIWSSALVKWGVVGWAGIVPVRRGDHWLVGAQQPDPGEANLTGAEIVSCDGIAFDTLARNQISLFKGDPAIEANLIDGAGSLLIDFRNPYLKRPRS